MNVPHETVAERLDRIAAEFTELDPRERLEALLEYADGLTPLPPELRAEVDRNDHRVHECQTPVFIWASVSQGRARLVAEVAPEAPTVKGFVGVLVEAFHDAPVEEVLAAGAGVAQRLGLGEALGMLRTRGLAAIERYIRVRLERAASSTPGE